MPAASSSDAVQLGATAGNALPFAATIRALMVAFGFIPFLHLITSVALMTAPLTVGATWKTFLLGLATLYLAGPLVVRLTTLLAPLPRGQFGINCRAFLLWWFTAQWQVLFNRLPLLEELLRMVPGLYSLWLRCWGARVGKLVYWSPGLVILDRPLVEVGSRVVFGVGVRINPHLLGPDAENHHSRDHMTLTVAPVRIGDDALVGGYSFLPAGAVVAPGEVLPGMRNMRMFSEWRGGKRRYIGAGLNFSALPPSPLAGEGGGEGEAQEVELRNYAG